MFEKSKLSLIIFGVWAVFAGGYNDKIVRDFKKSAGCLEYAEYLIDKIDEKGAEFDTKEKVKAAMSRMEPKFKALMAIMPKVMPEPSRKIDEAAQKDRQTLNILIHQAMMLGQVVGMNEANADYPRAQKRLETLFTVLEDLINEAHEKARNAGLFNEAAPKNTL